MRVPRPETRVVDELYGYSYSTPGLLLAPGGTHKVRGAPWSSGELRGAPGGSRELRERGCHFATRGVILQPGRVILQQECHFTAGRVILQQGGSFYNHACVVEGFA